MNLLLSFHLFCQCHLKALWKMIENDGLLNIKTCHLSLEQYNDKNITVSLILIGLSASYIVTLV